MRWSVLMPVIAALALPIAACAQTQAPPQPPADASAGQYQPGTLPPEPPVIMPPLPGQSSGGLSDNNAPPLTSYDTSQPPPQPPTSASQYQPGAEPDGQMPAGQADNMAPPAPDDGQPPPPPMQGAYGPPPGYGGGGDDPSRGDDPAGGDDPGRRDHEAAMMQKFQARFQAANTTNDGRLTLQQAQAANMRGIVAHFDEIDTQHLGYVTFNEVMAWKLDQMAQQMQRRAAQLRSQSSQ